MHLLPRIILVGYVLVVAFVDSRRSRIPNVLTVSAATAGLVLAIVAYGPHGLLAAAEGLLVGFFLFLPLYLLGGFGAGDVKAIAAAGSFLGPQGTFAAVICTLIIGGVAGVMVLLSAGGIAALKSLLGRWARLLVALSAGPWFPAPAQAPSGAAKLRFPYGIAIACGVVASLLRG